MAYMDILPDPTHKIKDTGVQDDTNGAAGPGFASVKFTSNQPTLTDRTRSGRVIQRSIQGHTWRVNIEYNPLTRAEFEPINSFLMAMQSNLQAFYVYLPQYLYSQNGPNETANTFAYEQRTTGSSFIRAQGTIPAGSSYMAVSYPGTLAPKPGDLFNIEDTNNSNHVKTYMVTRWETTGDHDTSPGAVTGGAERIHFNPPLTYSVANNMKLIFHKPKIRVISTKATQEYSLNTDNLFKFGLTLEEALP